MYAFKLIALLSIVTFVSAETLAKKPKEPKESKCDPVSCGLSVAKGTVSTISSCQKAGALAKKKKLSSSDKAELASDVAECVFESVSLGLDVTKDCKDCVSGAE